MHFRTYVLSFEVCVHSFGCLLRLFPDRGLVVVQLLALLLHIRSHLRTLRSVNILVCHLELTARDSVSTPLERAAPVAEDEEVDGADLCHV